MPSKYEVLEADRDFPWDRYVESSSHGTVSHLTGWIEALKNFSGSRLHRFAVLKGDHVAAICPMFLTNRGPLRLAYSPPLQGLTHHMGPVLVGYEGLANRKRAQLLLETHKALDSYLHSELGCNYIEIVYPPGLLDARPLIWTGYNVSLRHTYIIDLAKGVEHVWNEASHELRRNVRRCEGLVTSRVASVDELSDFLDVVRERFQDLGMKYMLTDAYVSELFQLLTPSHIRLFLAEESEVIQTGLIVLMLGRRATIWHGATAPRSSRLPINDYLHWSVVSWAEQQGFQELEIMGADDPRTERFKSKFSPELIPCLQAQRSRSWYRLAERIGRDPPSLF